MSDPQNESIYVPTWLEEAIPVQQQAISVALAELILARAKSVWALQNNSLDATPLTYSKEDAEIAAAEKLVEIQARHTQAGNDWTSIRKAQFEMYQLTWPDGYEHLIEIAITHNAEAEEALAKSKLPSNSLVEFLNSYENGLIHHGDSRYYTAAVGTAADFLKTPSASQVARQRAGNGGHARSSLYRGPCEEAEKQIRAQFQGKSFGAWDCTVARICPDQITVLRPVAKAIKLSNEATNLIRGNHKLPTDLDKTLRSLKRKFPKKHLVAIAQSVIDGVKNGATNP